MNKKISFVLVSAALAFTSAFAITALADDNSMRMDVKKNAIQPIENLLKKLQNIETKDFSVSASQLERGTPMTMTINPQGHVRITNAKVTSVSGDTIKIEIWKLSFSVHNMPDIRVLAANKRDLAFAQIAVGDMVDVLGDLDATTPALIHAQVIHDRTQTNKPSEEERTRLQALINELIKKLNSILTSRGQAPLSTPSVSALPSPSPSASASPSPSATP